MADKATQEEPKLSLPTGHPQAGYTAPDLSGHAGTGAIPDAEKEWHVDRNQAQQDEADAIADAEHKAATEEQKAAEEAEAAKAAEPTPAPTAAKTSTASKSS